MTKAVFPIAAGRALPLVLGLIIAGCNGGPKAAAKKDVPAGSSATEISYQYAYSMAKNGYCGQAMPIFICLADQGTGWAIAAHQAGRCALQIADDWKGPITRSSRAFPARSKVSFAAPYYQDATKMRQKGMAMLRRAGRAGWPDSQAQLVNELSADPTNTAAMAEAKAWLERYDANVRRKVYGTNAISSATRARLRSVSTEGRDTALKKEPREPSTLTDPFCRQIVRTAPPKPTQVQEKPSDHPLIKTPGHR